MADLHIIRLYAKRLERLSQRVKDSIWTGNERQLLNTLSAVAEVGEVARRLYVMLGDWTRSSPVQDAQKEQDEV